MKDDKREGEGRRVQGDKSDKRAKGREEGRSVGELEWVEGDKSEKIGGSSDKDEVLDDGSWQGSVCMEVTGSREVYGLAGRISVSNYYSLSPQDTLLKRSYNKTTSPTEYHHKSLPTCSPYPPYVPPGSSCISPMGYVVPPTAKHPRSEDECMSDLVSTSSFSYSHVSDASIMVSTIVSLTIH